MKQVQVDLTVVMSIRANKYFDHIRQDKNNTKMANYKAIEPCYPDLREHHTAIPYL